MTLSGEMMPNIDKTRRRHLRAYRFFKPLLAPYFRWRFNISALPAPDIQGPCLVIANHNADLDAVLIHLSFKDLLYFVASEHIFRAGLASKFIRRYFDPISRLKGSTDISTVRDIMRRLKAGMKVCLFAEGNRSYNGLTCPITPATGKLARLCGVPLVTYKFEGGYLTTPRWADTFRRGVMRGYAVNVYSPESLREMSDDEVNAAIAGDLFEDAYARQAVEKTRFSGKRLAEGLERSLFICPACERVGTLRGRGSEFACDCGLRAVYDEYGYLYGAPYATVTLWDAWQREKLAQIAAALEDAPAFMDPAVRLYQVTDHHTSKALYTGSAAMYRDRLDLGSFSFPIADMTDMAVYGKANVAWTCGDAHYELKADPPFCGRKYTELYQILKKNR